MDNRRTFWTASSSWATALVPVAGAGRGECKIAQRIGALGDASFALYLDEAGLLPFASDACFAKNFVQRPRFSQNTSFHPACQEENLRKRMTGKGKLFLAKV
jgi:hypothetical protein